MLGHVINIYEVFVQKLLCSVVDLFTAFLCEIDYTYLCNIQIQIQIKHFTQIDNLSYETLYNPLIKQNPRGKNVMLLILTHTNHKHITCSYIEL